MTDLFQAGKNCQVTAKAEKATLLIDSAAYYKALYHAICNARKSIFVLGWDIDGRIALLRGPEASNAPYPVHMRDLITQKARENPNLNIYLNRWNHSIFLSQEREPFSGFKWATQTPENVNYCSDFKIPFSACHHQKIIVVDDKVAFCGGMDIALERWDNRRHNIHQPRRHDPDLLSQISDKEYQPYHDIQIIVEGEIVKHLALLVRERWEKGAGYAAIPFQGNHHTPSPWPQYLDIHWRDIDTALARTIPQSRKRKSIQEIRRIYCGEIARAEKFIYIENQYLTSPDIAIALNKRLHENKDLRVLVISADYPRGFMERKAMWAGRVKFCDLVTQDLADGRLIVAYPVTSDGITRKTIHIHSKIFIVDDKFLHIGSSNLNNRSMGLDTECDLILKASNKDHAEQIIRTRNDLIREHTGLLLPYIKHAIQSGDIYKLIEYQKDSRQHLREIDNAPYRNEFLHKWAIKVGDPDKAFLLYNWPVRQILFFALVIGLFLYLGNVIFYPDIQQIASPENIKAYIEQARSSPLGLIYIALIYILAGLIFFPVTVLNLTTAVVFGPIYGLIYAVIGSLASASVAYGIGIVAGDHLKKFFRPVIEKIRQYTLKGGIAGMTIIRLIPIAPFTAVNITFGIARVSYISYIIATLFGLIPGIFAKAMLGGALGELWDNPEPRVIIFTIGSIALWLAIIWGSHRVYKYYQREVMA